MAKNSREGNRERTAKRRSVLAEQGIRPVQVFAPESAHPLIRQAAGLMTHPKDPVEPRAAFRRVGGANDPEPSDAPSTLMDELEAARKRIAEIERQMEARRIITAEAAERQRRELKAERDAAKAAEAEERTKAEKAIGAAQEAQGRVKEAVGRAEKAESAIRQVKALPGIKGRLVRWLSGDVLRT